MSPAKKKTRTMSNEHKAALAEGRSQGRAIRNYLDALEAHKPKPGRKRTADSIQRRLDAIDVALPDADALKRLDLVQERIDLLAELSTMDEAIDMTELEAGFIEHAQAYSQRKGISYKAWRSIGVSAAVLSAAGITRGS